MSDMPTSFDGFIQSNDKPVLVDFWAEWCQPCKMMGPILKSLAQDWKDRLTVIKVNIDDKPHLAQRFDVTAVPTMVLFKSGQEVHRMGGVMPLMQLKNALQSFL